MERGGWDARARREQEKQTEALRRETEKWTGEGERQEKNTDLIKTRHRHGS